MVFETAFFLVKRSARTTSRLLTKCDFWTKLLTKANSTPSAVSLPPPVLNERQRHYLLAAYQLDQQIEHQRRRDFARGMPDPERTPAAVWRAMPYGRWQHRVLEGKPPTPLRELLDPQLVSPGTGSTWKALAERGLVELSDRTICFPGMALREYYDLPHVSLTRAGRKLARELLGEVRPPRPKKPKPPPGLLPYWGPLRKRKK